MRITAYKYEKVPTEDTEFFVPEEPFYCFQTGVRRAIRMIPRFVTWDGDPNAKKGDLYELEVTCVYQSFECKVEKFKVLVRHMEDHVNREIKSKDADITRMLVQEDYYVRTKEQFDADLQNVLNQINKI